MEDGEDVEGDSSRMPEPVVSSHVRISTGEGPGSRYELTELNREEAGECSDPAPLDHSERGHDVLHGASPGSESQLPVEGEMASVLRQSQVPVEQSEEIMEAEQSSHPTQSSELENAPAIPPPSRPPAATPPAATPPPPTPPAATPPETTAMPPQTSATPSNPPPAVSGTQGSEEEDRGGKEIPDCSGRLSPFIVVPDEGLVPVFESPGLLFAHGVSGRHNRFVVGQCPLLLSLHPVGVAG